MDDAALDRALFALELEEPPADLRGRILAATVYRPALPFKIWEVWVIGTLMALAVWLMIAVLASVPDAGLRLASGAVSMLERLERNVSPSILGWVVVGASSAFWISQFTLPRALPARRTR